MELQEFLNGMDGKLTGLSQEFRTLKRVLSEAGISEDMKLKKVFAKLISLESHFHRYKNHIMEPQPESQEKQYQLLYKTSLLLGSSVDVRELLDLAIDTLIEMTQAQRGFLTLLDEKGGYRIEVARNFEKETIPKEERRISDTVIHRVLDEKDHIQVDKSGIDEHLLDKSSIMRTGVRAIICVPVFIRGDLKGIIYLDRMEKPFPGFAFGLVKHFSQQIAGFLRSAEEFDSLKENALKLKEQIKKQYSFGGIIYKSKAMRDIVKTVVKIADTDVSVLIGGETGTGKELIARAIHENSHRSDGPFIEVDCGALPGSLIESELFGYVKGAFTGAAEDKTGLLQSANGGTIFLDEINNLPMEFQPKLMRVLQQKSIRRIGETGVQPVDFRLITAASSDLRDAVEKNQFRQDLYYRINTITLLLPALRERPEDIFALTSHFLNYYSEIYEKPVKDFSPGFLKALENYIWEGNVRELEHVIERAVIMCEETTLRTADLPEGLGFETLSSEEQYEDLSLNEYLTRMKKDYITQVLRECHWKKVDAASRLGINRSYLFKLIKQLDITAES